MAQATLKKSDVHNSLQQAITKDDEDCRNLVKAYQTLLMCANENTLLQEHAQKFDKNFFDKVEQSIADLKMVERPILVIGETSAGKSSFLNMLIGRDILPELTAPCTHCMCCIKKGETLEAHIRSIDGSTSKKTQIISGNYMNDKTFRSKLKDLVDAKSCAKDSNRCIDIFVPSNILKGNVYLVDTPGFGDTPQLTASLVRLLPKAIGIIFILNSTVALGIGENGIPILTQIQKLMTTGKIPLFDPSKMVFIANKWDQIKEDEEENHWEKTKERLQTVWPHYRKDRLLPLSVEIVRKRQNSPGRVFKEYPSAMTDYKKVLNEIREIVQQCTRSELGVHSSYINTFVGHLQANMDVVEQFKGLSSKDNETKARVLQILIADLESTYEQVKGNRILRLDANEISILAQRVYHYLHDSANKMEIFKWTEDNIPNEKFYLHLKDRATVVISNLIVKAIRQKLKQIKLETRYFKTSLSHITEKFGEKEAKMKSFLKSSKMKLELPDEPPITDLPPREDDFANVKVAAFIVTLPIVIPLIVVGSVTVVPVWATIDIYKNSQYRRNPITFLDRWSKKILKEKFTSAEVKAIAMDMLTKDIQDQLQNFSKSIGNYHRLLKSLDPKWKTADVVRDYDGMKKLKSQLDELMKKVEVEC